MTFKDGFKFGLGYFIAGGMIRYAEEVIVEKNPKYTYPLKRIAKALNVKSPSNPAADETSCKKKIGFTIE